MAKKKQERVQVKLEFLRMLIKMELDPARMTLLTGFFETYLRLNTAETRELEEEMGKMDDKEAEKMMELTTSWEERGRLKGRIEGRNEGRIEGRNEGRIEGRIEGKIEGQAELLLKQLKTKFKDIPLDMEHKIKTLPAEKLEEIAEAIFDFKSIDDVNAFI